VILYGLSIARQSAHCLDYRPHCPTAELASRQVTLWGHSAYVVPCACGIGGDTQGNNIYLLVCEQPAAFLVEIARGIPNSTDRGGSLAIVAAYPEPYLRLWHLSIYCASGDIVQLGVNQPNYALLRTCEPEAKNSRPEATLGVWIMGLGNTRLTYYAISGKICCSKLFIRLDGNIEKCTPSIHATAVNANSAIAENFH
jgi:hypothetical protein